MKRKIILVEDDDFTREGMESAIQKVGYEVVAYARASQAFEDIKMGLEYNLLITDLSFSNRSDTALIHYSGEDIISISGILNPLAPIISISGYDKEIEGVRRLSKPVRPSALLNTIKELLPRE